MTLIAVAPAGATSPLMVASGHYVMTDYIGSFAHKTAGPQAYLVRQSAPVLGAHFHEVDQFQVIMNGAGALGRERAVRGLVHYTDAYTPYGPIEADADGGLEYFTLRRNATVGANFMPEARAKRTATPTDHFTISVAGQCERPAGFVEWQRSRRGAAVFGSNATAGGAVEIPVSDLDRDGFVVVFDGAVILGGDTYPAGSVLAFSTLSEFADGHAGPDGVALIIMTFAAPRGPRAPVRA